MQCTPSHADYRHSLAASHAHVGLSGLTCMTFVIKLSKVIRNCWNSQLNAITDKIAVCLMMIIKSAPALHRLVIIHEYVGGRVQLQYIVLKGNEFRLISKP